MAQKVSVVIPSYNRAYCLEKAIDSVMAQTFRDFEIVLIDDGSTDTTRQVIEKYDRRVRYFYQENRGIAGARNSGIKNSEGDFIAFLDSDDYWRSEKLERQVQLFKEHPEYGLVASCCASVRLDGSFRERNRRGKSGWVLEDLFKANFIRTSSAIIRKACFSTVGLFDEALRESEEYDLWLRLAAEYPVGFINDSLAVYVDNPNGASVDSLAGRLFRLRTLEKEYLCRRIPKAVYRKRMARNYHVVGRHYLKRGDRENGLAYLKKSQHLAPLFVKNLAYLGLGLLKKHKVG